MAIGEKRRCTYCGKEVEVVGEVGEGNVVHQKLDCGHTSDRKIINLQEIVKSKDFMIQALEEEGAAVRLSGSSGVSQIFSLSNLQGTFNTTGDLVINQRNISITNYSPLHMETKTITNITNLQDIFTQIDRSDSSSEDKEKLKGVLSRVHNELKSLGGIITIAAPFVPPIIKMLMHSS